MFIVVRYANHYIKHKFIVVRYVMQKFILVRYANYYIKHKYVMQKFILVSYANQLSINRSCKSL